MSPYSAVKSGSNLKRKFLFQWSNWYFSFCRVNLSFGSLSICTIAAENFRWVSSPLPFSQIHPKSDMMWYDVIWHDVIWYDMLWHDMIWYDIISYYVTSHHVISCRITPYTSYHSYHSISYHIMAYHIISHHIISFQYQGRNVNKPNWSHSTKT